jgi:Rrf2 family transcriptional regulator, iron-sulfur cluster assembly transcription factor
VELSTRGRYAVMAMADLARASADIGAVPLSAIAERQMISLAYLEQLFARLRRAELVESERGRTGGYRLARRADQITIAEIMAAVDESTAMTRCGGYPSEACISGKRCITHGLWEALGDHIEQFLAMVTLQQIIDGRFNAQPHNLATAPDVLFTAGVVTR